MKVPPTVEGRLQYGVLVTLLVAIISAAVAWGTAQSQLTDTRTRVNTLETQERSTNDTLIEVRQDVKWIRERLK